MVIRQQKAMRSGAVRRWDLDLAAMQSCARWAQQRPGLLREELDQILTAFPTLVAGVGRPLSDDRCWVEAAEPVLCPECSELVVFDRGTRCAECEQPVAPPASAVIGLVGRIPALISGRPFLGAIERRIAALRRAGDGGRAALWSRALLEAGGRHYLAPRYGVWFAQAWPHNDPPVMVWPEYFEMLDIPPDHVYYADQYYRLCLYASWREQPACRVLQNRVVPRLLIDLMVADLQAHHRLDDALQRLDVTLYELYNMVGRTEQTLAFKQIYEELIRT